MNDPAIQQKCLEYELKLAAAQAEHGSESMEMAVALEQYADFLRLRKIRLLEAANFEARARVIRKELQSPAPKAVARAVSSSQSESGECSRCGAATISGAIYSAHGEPLLWVDPGKAREGGVAINLRAVRCSKCGYVEFYGTLET